jgi:outer membrane lipoprotein-sorting protein
VSRAPAAVAIALSLAAATARGDETAALVARLDQSARGVETLAGEFTQRSRLKLFRQELHARGRLYYRRPSELRWEYTAPDPSVLVIAGERATMTTPDAPPERFDLARDPTLRAVTDQLFLWLGSASLARAGAEYTLVAGGTTAAPTLALTPKPGTPLARAFAGIELRFDDKLLLRAILLRERGGDEKEITFTKMERNAKLPSGAFSP